MHSFDTISQARNVLKEYIIFYNRERPHQSLDYQTPNEVYYNKSATKVDSDKNLENHILETEGGIVNSQIQPIFMS